MGKVIVTAAIAEALNLEVATPDEARRMLGLR